MVKKVNEEEVRKMELRRQLEGAKCDEFDERCKDSGNGSISTADVTNPVLPAVLFPSGGEVGINYMSDTNPTNEGVIAYLRTLPAADPVESSKNKL